MNEVYDAGIIDLASSDIKMYHHMIMLIQLFFCQVG